MDNRYIMPSSHTQARLQSDFESEQFSCANCKKSDPMSAAPHHTQCNRCHRHHHHHHHHHHPHQYHHRHYHKSSTYISAHTQIILKRLCCALLFVSLFNYAYGCGPGRGIGGPRRNRKLTPLVFKQHVPNMSEKNLGASALSEGAIRRDSPKFKNLVPNYNKDIIFKDEEGTGADRLMTQRCKEKLNTLAVSVMNQWPGVRLRVTESWDEDNLHGAESLHYEGRAVDITTSDRDRTKYGMLARLAVEAGFDWVYYESRAHIHCSVKSDSSHISHVSGCFSSNSTVLTSNGHYKSMAALEIGDRVLTMGDHGEAKFSEVILFMDRQLDLVEDFVEIHAENGAILTLTPAHLVLLWNSKMARVEYRFADKVEEGDLVFVTRRKSPRSSSSTADDDDDDVDEGHLLQPHRVVQLRAVRHRGVVAPLTREGTIVVNSVAASCYAVINSQKLAHWGMLPMRLLASLRKAAMWQPSFKSKVFHDIKAKAKKINEKEGRVNSGMMQQNGVHWYAKMLYAFKNYLVPRSWRYQ